MDITTEGIRFVTYIITIGGTLWAGARYYIKSETGKVAVTAQANKSSIDGLQKEDSKTDTELKNLKKELQAEFEEKIDKLSKRIEENHTLLLQSVTAIAEANAEARLQTERDLGHIRERVTGETISPSTLDNRLRDLSSQMHARIGNVETNLRGDVANLRTEVNQRLT